MKRQTSSTFAIRRSSNRGAWPEAARIVGSLRDLAQIIAPRLSRPYGVTDRGKSLADEGNSAPIGGSAGEIAGLAEDEDPRVRQMRLEAVLLLAKTPLSPRKLSQMAHLADATEARTLVRQLNRIYDSLGRAIRVEQIAGGYRLLTRPALAPWLARLGHLPPAVRLSTPMMETLAVVAYRQPVSRASAEAVRGVACGELLRQLMERDLIRIVGRSEELGRPYLYGTTKRFLQLFGLPNATSLPPIQWQALQDEPISEDSPPDLSTSTKEPVVSISVASVRSEADPEVLGIAPLVAPALDAAVGLQESRAAIDDEDELDDDADEDWDDDDDDDDDWDDEEDDDDDDADDGWEEVDDEDADADDEDDDDDDDDDEEEDDVDVDVDDDEDEDDDWDDDDDEDWDDDEDVDDEEDDDWD